MDEAQAPSNRRSVRKPVLLSASVEVDGTLVPVKLRNLSEEGALLDGSCFPKVGASTWFERGRLRVQGTIVWVTQQSAGIAFVRRLDAAEVLRHIAPPRPHREVVHRRPGVRTHPLG